MKLNYIIYAPKERLFNQIYGMLTKYFFIWPMHYSVDETKLVFF